MMLQRMFFLLMASLFAMSSALAEVKINGFAQAST